MLGAAHRRAAGCAEFRLWPLPYRHAHLPELYAAHSISRCCARQPTRCTNECVALSHVELWLVLQSICGVLPLRSQRRHWSRRLLECAFTLGGSALSSVPGLAQLGAAPARSGRCTHRPTA